MKFGVGDCEIQKSHHRSETWGMSRFPNVNTQKKKNMVLHCFLSGAGSCPSTVCLHGTLVGVGLKGNQRDTTILVGMGCPKNRTHWPKGCFRSYVFPANFKGNRFHWTYVLVFFPTEKARMETRLGYRLGCAEHQMYPLLTKGILVSTLESRSVLA